MEILELTELAVKRTERANDTEQRFRRRKTWYLASDFFFDIRFRAPQVS